MRGIIPFLARVTGSHRDTAQLRRAGFEDVNRVVEVGIFSEYTGRKPGGPGSGVRS